MAPAKWQLTVTAAALYPLVALLLTLLLSSVGLPFLELASPSLQTEAFVPAANGSWPQFQ